MDGKNSSMYGEAVVRVILVYPFDPLGQKIGGIQTFLKGFIRYAPPHFELKLLGTSANAKARPKGELQHLNVQGKSVEYLPLINEPKENVSSRFPLSLRFALALANARARDFCRGGVLLFNRIEPSAVLPLSLGPRIGFVHNDITDALGPNSETKWKVAPRVYRLLEGFLIQRFDHVFVVNGNTYRVYRETYPNVTNRLTFLPTWVDDQMFSSSVLSKVALRKELPIPTGVPSDGLWVLFVGRFQDQKDPLLLIRSFAVLKRDFPEARLILVGEGNLRGDMERLTLQLGVDKDVFFVGFLEQEILAHLYQCSDVLVLTSHFEGMPRCVVEAVGSGLPVVTLDVGEVRRVVIDGQTGVVVSRRDPVEVAQAIIHVVSKRSGMQDSRFQEVVEPYRPKTVLAPLFDLCEKLYGDI